MLTVRLAPQFTVVAPAGTIAPFAGDAGGDDVGMIAKLAAIVWAAVTLVKV